MNKTFALILALLMVVSFAACGSSEPEEKKMTVKFATVTNIFTYEGNNESIALTMEAPSSSMGAERDVYIAAVDYVFTHAPVDLNALSVVAYDSNGNIIKKFTMPSYLLTSLREIEAQGSWGTEGFSSFFYFNSEAYDVLVASCINQ